MSSKKAVDRMQGMQSQVQILAIDSSINKIGYAIWNGRLVESGVIRTRGRSIPEKVSSLRNGLIQVVRNKKIDKAFVETAIRGFSYTARTSQWSGKALNQSALHKLNLSVGVIMTTLTELGIEVRGVEATDWKARRSKKMDTAIASKIAGKRISHDEADAIMLALWATERRGL